VLNFTLLSCKVVSILYGIPLPLPAFIPGDSTSEQLQSLVVSLSDVLGPSVHKEGSKLLAEVRRSKDEATLKRLLCERADGIDAEAHLLVRDLAKQQGNNGWEDEMVAANRGDEWAWVKKENKEKWETAAR